HDGALAELLLDLAQGGGERALLVLVHGPVLDGCLMGRKAIGPPSHGLRRLGTTRICTTRGAGRSSRCRVPLSGNPALAPGRQAHRLGLTSPQYRPSMAKSWSGSTSIGAKSGLRGSSRMRSLPTLSSFTVISSSIREIGRASCRERVW